MKKNSLILIAFMIMGFAVKAQTNLALGKPVIASTSYNASFAASYAVDGNTGTRWSSVYNELEWIYVDLGKETNITGVKITWEAAYSANYNIETSNDAKNWTILKTITGNSSLDNHITGLSGRGRYVRINCTKRATSWGHSIWELEVYGERTTKLKTKVKTVQGSEKEE